MRQLGIGIEVWFRCCDKILNDFLYCGYSQSIDRMVDWNFGEILVDGILVSLTRLIL